MRNLVELEKRCKMSIWLQKSALIQLLERTVFSVDGTPSACSEHAGSRAEVKALLHAKAAAAARAKTADDPLDIEHQNGWRPQAEVDMENSLTHWG